MDNPILIVAICTGKSIFPESRGKLYKQDSNICKICLPYKEMQSFLIWTSGSVGDFV